MACKSLQLWEQVPLKFSFMLLRCFIPGSTRVSCDLGGGAHKFLGDAKPKLLLDSLKETKITMTMTPPVLLKAVVDHLSDESCDLDHLRIFICGGAPVPYELLKAASEKMKFTTMVQGYGMTETSPIISFLNLRDASKEKSPSAVFSQANLWLVCRQN